MLTAGFATPVMSALICNQTEPHLAKWLNNRKNKKADEILSNIDTYSQKYQNNATKNNIEELINQFGGKPVNEELINKTAEAFDGMDPITFENLKTDLKELMTTKTFAINNDTAKAISENLKSQFKGKAFSEDAINAIIRTLKICKKSLKPTILLIQIQKSKI